MAKHTELFKRMVARIRSLNVIDGAIFIDRIEEVYKTDINQSIKLYQELIDAGAIREFKNTDIRDGKFEGNILWKNIRKFKIPKNIAKEESERVKVELEQGKFPKTVADSKFYKSMVKRLKQLSPNK